MITNYWQQFTNSGKIEDYLSYINRDCAQQKNNQQETVPLGENPYAGIHMCDRDHTETDAYRGI
ncbi:hypothetical protein LJC58_09190 [Lachnospiraceae bacterium OttesenSCG-928-D06]|nr:hypothetical protein [Lachnospiraceae bacterium OttesenSCG-928-D06]